MKRATLALVLGLLLSMSLSVWAQEDSNWTPTVSYTFTDVQYSGDTFTQLLGINNGLQIAGYHNFNVNSGFTLVLPNHFTTENYPGSMMTQVIGINNNGKTSGFYVDQAGKTHGFTDQSGVFATVDFPGSVFNQLLSQNDNHQAAGYYSQSIGNTTPDFPYVYDETGGVFEVITIPGAVGGAQATGINNSGQVCGFWIDSKGVNHGFWLNQGTFQSLNFPGGSFTQALGINNTGLIVGVYMQNGNTHGFTYNTLATTNKWQSIDDPNGVGTTVVNGVNDKGDLVGFWGNAPTNTGFVAKPL